MSRRGRRSPDPSGNDEGGGSARLSRRRLLGTGLTGIGVGVAGSQVLGRPATPPARHELPVARPVLITDVTIVEPRTGSSLERASVLVREGRVVAVGRDVEVPASVDADHLDGDGRHLVPGFANMHSHALQAERPQLLMASMLAEGVTGFRQMLGSPDLLRHRAEHRLPVSASTPGVLSMPGDLLLPFNAGSPDDARAEIARQWDAGADFVKLALVGRETFFAAVEEARSRRIRISGHLPPGVAYAEAAEAGFGPIEHLGTGPAVWIACSSDGGELATRVDDDLPVPGWVARLPFVDELSARRLDQQLINPAAFASDEDVALLRDAVATFDEARARALGARLADLGCWQSPTLVRLRTQYCMDDPAYAGDPWLDSLSADSRADYDEVLGRFRDLSSATRATYRQVYARCLDVVRVWHEQGVPIVAGTDGQGRAPGQWMRGELRELAAAGLGPVDVLRAATSAPATLLGREATLGTVAAGADADLVLLGSDPLADAEHLADVSVVVRAGHVHTAAQLSAEVERLRAEGEDEHGLAALLSARAAVSPCC